MFKVNRASDRGNANFGWLESQHTFSFGRYYHPEKLGFSSLLVINDDTVKGGAGFTTHSHRDMEIISYVVEGHLMHKDSSGNTGVLSAGEYQLMSAGNGIQHSEFNQSKSETLRFLQIWIQPNVVGRKPAYQQQSFGREEGATLIASPNGEANSLSIKQDAKLHQLILNPSGNLQLPLEQTRHYYLHLIEGELLIDKTTHLQPGDGIEISRTGSLNIRAIDSGAQALFFDLV